MTPCIVTPITLEITQYRARPLGKFKEKNANIRGIIQSIIWLVDCCLASTEGMVVIFCWAQVDTPTSTGKSIFVGSGLARSIQRKSLFNGTSFSARGFQEYSL